MRHRAALIAALDGRVAMAGIALLLMFLLEASASCPPYVPPYEPPYVTSNLCDCWEDASEGTGSGVQPGVLQAAFSYAPSEGEAPLLVEFHDESTGDIAEWHWDFGDGRTSAERSPVTEYLAFGQYDITLTVRDAGGSESRASHSIEVLRGDPGVLPHDTLAYATAGSVNSLDPAACSNSLESTIILNLYESLFEWPAGNVDADERDLNYSLDSRDLVPMLGTVVPTIDNGLIVELSDGRVQYIVPIRRGVVFQDGNDLTAGDVEYSLERAVLLGSVSYSASALIAALSGGAYSGLYELVEDVLSIDTNQGQTIPDLTAWEQSRIYEAIDPWIEVDYADNVVFTLDAPYAPFLSMLAHGNTVSSILDREWCVEWGSWDGEPETWAAHDTESALDSPLRGFANGTGPFVFESLQPDQVAILVRFDGYWRGPAQLERVEILLVPEEASRVAALESGDSDIADISAADSLAWMEGMEGVVTQADLPKLTMLPVAFFNTEIAVDDNRLVGSGELGEDGIPFDFFADVHVRKAFAYAFDGWAYIDQLLWATGGYETIGPIPKAFRWAYEDSLYSYGFDLEKAAEELRLAYDGMLWDAGFTMTLPYYMGNYERELQWLIWQDSIESLNPRFHIEVRSVPSGEYWDLWGSGRIPLLTGGWVADYPDPHNFARAFASSGGYFARYFPLGDTLRAALADSYDPLISAAQAATDQEERASIYREIQAMLYEDCFYVWLPQASGCRVMRDWVQGWRFNPALPGPYFYTMYKG